MSENDEYRIISKGPNGATTDVGEGGLYHVAGMAAKMVMEALEDGETTTIEVAPVSVSAPCEFTECKSGQPVAIHVTENIEDGSWRVGICARCAEITGLTDGGDINDPGAVNAKLNAAYGSVSEGDGK